MIRPPLIFLATLAVSHPLYLPWDMPEPLALPVAGQNAVFSCNTEAFTVFSTGNSFIVRGKMDVPHPAYTYHVSALETGTDGVARGVITFDPPQTRDEKEDGSQVSELEVEAAFPTPSPAMRLVVKFDKPFGFGPDEIDCLQVGGSQ